MSRSLGRNYNWIKGTQSESALVPALFVCLGLKAAGWANSRWRNLKRETCSQQPLNRLVLAILVVLGLWVPTHAAHPSQLLPPIDAFESGNHFYEQGKFAEAAAAYERALDSGRVSAALYFNLGNAFFKAGQLGRAIAAYRRAEEISPRDPDLRANLQFARNQVQGPSWVPDRRQQWLSRLSLKEWTLLACAGVWLVFLLLALMQLRPALRRSLSAYVIGLVIGTGLVCGCFGAAFHQTHFVRRAIVTINQAPAHEVPFEDAKAQFSLRDGAEIQIVDQKDDWFQVMSDPRRVGWIRRDQVAVLAP